VYDYDEVGNRQSEKYNHLTIPVWDKYHYDNLRRLNQADYAASSGFAYGSRSVPASESAYRLSFLASAAQKWLDDETRLAVGDTTAAQIVIPNEREESVDSVSSSIIPSQAGIPSLSSTQSAKSVVANIYSLAEFGQSEPNDPEIRSETIRDDNGNISAQIVYDAQDRITLFTLYPDSGGKVVITSVYDTDGSQTSNICATYDTNGNILSREEMPLPAVTTETVATTETVIPNPPVADEESVYSATSSFASEADLWLLEADLLYSRGSMLMSAPSGQSSSGEEFVYDHLGNRYQVIYNYGIVSFTNTYVHNSVNQYQKQEVEVFGNPVESLYFYDDNGNLDEVDGWVYQYDYRNRLISISDGVTTTAQYTYDALGRRICKVADGKTTYFYYNTSQQVIAEYEGTTPQLTKEYVYGNSINEILCMFFPQDDVGEDDFQQFLAFCAAWLSETGDGNYDDSLDVVNDNKIDFKDFAVFAAQWGTFPSNEESHYYYLTDALGSVRGLIGGKFNREDDREFYNYDVYGAPTYDSFSSAGNPYMFAGYRNDSESGLYHLVNRMYDAYMGRLLQFDPSGYKDGMNLYEYAKSAPTLLIDPLGLSGYYPIPIAQPASNNNDNKGYADAPTGWPIVPGDAWERRPAECTAIDGYFRHCVSACRLNRVLRASGFHAASPFATYTIGLWWGNDWPWNKNQAVDSPSDREAYRHGIAYSYLPGTCRSSCTKGLVKQCKKRCPCSQSCEQTTPVISDERKTPIPY
jgi:RHS repeat-associated protein